MQNALTRRRILAGAAAAALGPAGAAWSADDALAALERESGGRLGVFALDTGSARRLAHRADERFLMCSTFKLIVAAAVLTRIEAGRERLDRRIAYGPADLLDYAPVTRAHLAEGAMSVEALVAAAMEVSDNTAANLLLASVGGPGAVTAFARRIGDGVTRLDRNEPALNRPDGILDTTSPRAMAGSARAILLGDALSGASRQRLQGWMVASTPGLGRLRAGLPAPWRSGDKSGTGASEANDVAVAWPPGRPPLVIAAYYDAPGLDGPSREAVLREVGRIVAAWLR
jgi:beta-lactamase class A